MFDALSERLERVGAGLRGRGRITDADLDEALAEVRVALLEADVELSVARAFLDAVRARVAGAALSRASRPGQQVLKAVHDELVEVLGGESLRVTYALSPADGHPPGRPPGRRQDDRRGQAGARGSSARGAAAPRGGRPAAPGRGRAAARCSAPRPGSRSSPATRPGRRGERRRRRGPARRARRRHRGHRGPPGGRRGADGRGRRGQPRDRAALHVPRHRRGDRPGRGTHRAAVPRGALALTVSSSPSSTTTRAAARCSRRAASSASRSSSRRSASGSRTSTFSTPTGWRVGSSGWATP